MPQIKQSNNNPYQDNTMQYSNRILSNHNYLHSRRFSNSSNSKSYLLIYLFIQGNNIIKYKAMNL